jgi:hypothetical protein
MDSELEKQIQEVHKIKEADKLEFIRHQARQRVYLQRKRTNPN